MGPKALVHESLHQHVVEALRHGPVAPLKVDEKCQDGVMIPV